MHGDCAAFLFKYDEPMSHLIYAASDIIVIPSAFEPCGLTQMIAMRYGTGEEYVKSGFFQTLLVWVGFAVA